MIDLRIKRADLPPANEAAIFRRMQTNRQQEAERIKAIGHPARPGDQGRGRQGGAGHPAITKEEAEGTAAKAIQSAR